MPNSERRAKEGKVRSVAQALLAYNHSTNVERDFMVEMISKHNRLIIGAIIIAIVIVVYLVFFCPTECH